MVILLLFVNLFLVVDVGKEMLFEKFRNDRIKDMSGLSGKFIYRIYK